MHSLLENYLTEVSAHLKPLPVARREEELREMRQHLLKAVAVHQEQGQSEDEAVKEVLKQFGVPHAIGLDIVAAWRRGRRMGIINFWPATTCALTLFYVLDWGRSILFNKLLIHFAQVKSVIHNGHIEYQGVLGNDSPIFHAGIDAINFGVPILVGCVTGLLFPKRAIAATTLALSVVYGDLYARVLYATRHHWQAEHALVSAYSISLPVLLVVAVFCAWCGCRWRERRLWQDKMNGLLPGN